MEGIQVSVERAGVNNNIAVIKVGGYIDTTTSAELEHSLDSLLKAGMYKIIIDLGNVDYISSAGWGIFISEIKGIREKGGDLKLVRMIPDVYEVFELLEFHYILKAFDTLQEAVRDFDRDATPYTEKQVEQPGSVPKEPEYVASSGDAVVTERTRTSTTGPVSVTQDSLEDKIKAAVINNPQAGTFKLKKILSSPRYGQVNIGFFQLRKILKKLRLDSKERRVRFYRQRATR